MDFRDRPIIIGGVPRSGTTLLRAMLTSHPNFRGGPEFKLLPKIMEAYNLANALKPVMSYYQLDNVRLNSIFGDFIKSFFEGFYQIHGSKRLVEKTPQNIHFFKELALVLPQAQFIHVVRDGRDVANSLSKMQWISVPDGRPIWYVQNRQNAFTYWVQSLKEALALETEPHLAARVYLVKYEDLVMSPKETLQAVLAFLGEPWSDRVLEFYRQDRSGEPREASTEQITNPLYKDSVGTWMRESTPDDIATFKRLGGAVLMRLGYEHSSDWQVHYHRDIPVYGQD